MILALAIAIGLVAGWVTGGTVRQLSKIRLHWAWVAIFALVMQAGTTSVLGPSARGSALVWVWVFLAATACAVCLVNWRVAGMPIVAFGLLLNLVVVVANAGMPVSPSAIAAFGVDAATRMASRPSSFYHLATDATRLRALADVVPIPWLPATKAILSVGDLALLSGLALVLGRGMHASD